MPSSSVISIPRSDAASSPRVRLRRSGVRLRVAAANSSADGRSICAVRGGAGSVIRSRTEVRGNRSAVRHRRLAVDHGDPHRDVGGLVQPVGEQMHRGDLQVLQAQIGVRDGQLEASRPWSSQNTTNRAIGVVPDRPMLRFAAAATWTGRPARRRAPAAAPRPTARSAGRAPVRRTAGRRRCAATGRSPASRRRSRWGSMRPAAGHPASATRRAAAPSSGPRPARRRGRRSPRPARRRPGRS